MIEMSDEEAEKYAPQNLSREDWETIEFMARERLTEFGSDQFAKAYVFAYFDFLFSVADSFDLTQ